jgi:hypothetical protein
MAEQGQIVEFGRALLAEGEDVVDLEARGHPTAGDHTGPVPVDEGGAQGLVDGPAPVGDGLDVPGPVEDEPEEAVVGQGAGHGHRDGSQAVDLTQLTGLGLAPEQGVQVHPDHEGTGRWTIDDGEGVGGGGVVVPPGRAIGEPVGIAVAVQLRVRVAVVVRVGVGVRAEVEQSGSPDPGATRRI